MMRIRRLAGPALLAAAFLLPAIPAAAEDPPAPAASASKDGKVRKLLELMRWKEQVLLGLEESFDMQVRLGTIPPAFPKKFKEVADFEALEKLTLAEFGAAFDEKTLDAAIAFYGTEEGGKYAQGTLVVTRALMKKIEPWAMETAMKAMAEIMGGEDEEEVPPSAGDIAADGSIGSNETLAIRALRNIAVCQAQIQTSGKIDCDEDGIGEYGTLVEMAGGAGVRKGFIAGGSDVPPSADFSMQGRKVDPPILTPLFAEVDPWGVARRNGYCFRVFLPDTSRQAGFVHETGPAAAVGLEGGTGKIGVDLSETTWCVYAWPEKRGETGNRVFFCCQSGDVSHSSNEKAKWEGTRAPTGEAAFLGAGITGQIAIGTAGRDGDVWKVVN